MNLRVHSPTFNVPKNFELLYWQIINVSRTTSTFWFSFVRNSHFSILPQIRIIYIRSTGRPKIEKFRLARKDRNVERRGQKRRKFVTLRIYFTNSLRKNRFTWVQNAELASTRPQFKFFVSRTNAKVSLQCLHNFTPIRSGFWRNKYAKVEHRIMFKRQNWWKLQKINETLPNVNDFVGVLSTRSSCDSRLHPKVRWKFRLKF